jgi:UDP:flavonoid glycosyltransferase YjiC (YdhE family)
MRVLLGVSGWQTHYFTMAPLAWAFRVAGHEVLVTSQPSLTDVIRRSGISTIATGPDVDLVGIRRRSLAIQRADGPPADPAAAQADMAEISGMWREITQSNLQEVVDLARSWKPDLVVADPLCPAGLVAAHLLGVPGIRYQLAPDPVVGSRDGERMLGLLPGFYEPYERFGLTIDGDPARLTVDPCPPSMLPPPASNRVHMSYVPYNGPFRPPVDLPPPTGRPRICLTWGTTVARTFGADFVGPQNALITSLLAMGAEVVVVVDEFQRPMLGDQPPGVHIVDSAPLHLIVPSCTAIVHQGGAGSVLTAARFGLAQLSVSYIPDQAHVAEVHAATGAGIHLVGEHTRTEDIQAAAERLITDPSYRDGAHRLQDEMLRQPSANEIVRRLADLVKAG